MASMVDITKKKEIIRIAKAKGKIYLKQETIELIEKGKIEKGDVATVTKVVAIEAAKKASQLLPFCHPIPITHIDVEVITKKNYIEVEVTVKGYAKTGVEMEALTAVGIALLNVWDMVKKYEKDEKGQYPTTRISDIVVVEKIKVSDDGGS